MFAAFSSSFITTPGMTRRIQLTLSLYGRTWIRWNSSRRCSPRIEAYRMFVSTPRMMSSYSARRRAIAVSPIGSTKPAHRRAEFSQSRYSGESSRIFTWYDVAVPWISTSGYSSFAPPVPIDATVNRSTRPLIAPRASCNAGNSAICPFSRSSRKLTLRLREEPVHHPLGLEPADVLVRLSEVVDQDDVPTPRPRVFDGVEGDGGGIRSRAVLDQLEADRLRVLLELLDRPSAECVRRGDHAGVAFLHDMIRELRNRRRLARPVHADEHDDEGSRALLDEAEEVEGRHREGLRDRVPQGRLRALREARVPGDPFSLEVLREAVHDLLGDGECHVRLEEGDLQVVQ